MNLSDLDDVELERIAGECDVAGADYAKRGQYNRADDLKLAGAIVRAYAEAREGLSDNLDPCPGGLLLSAGTSEGATLWPAVLRSRVSRLFTRSVSIEDSDRFKRSNA
jgi:hypothetical protein